MSVFGENGIDIHDLAEEWDLEWWQEAPMESLLRENGDLLQESLDGTVGNSMFGPGVVGPGGLQASDLDGIDPDKAAILVDVLKENKELIEDMVEDSYDMIDMVEDFGGGWGDVIGIVRDIIDWVF